MAQVKTVRGINVKEGKTGKPYWQIVWDDGKTDNIFDPLFHDKAKMAKENGWGLSITKEENDKGYFNISALEFVEVIPEKGTNIPKTEQAKSTKETDGKAIAVAISYAKDLVCAGKIELNEIIPWVDTFYVWMTESWISGSAGLPQTTPKATQSKSSGIVEESENLALVEAALDAGAEVILSSEDVKAKVQKLMETNKTLKVGTFVDMMEKLQVGVKERGKNKMNVPTLLGSYQALTDENKVKFSKSL